MQKRIGPKRVSVFELGAGEVAFSALGQALRKKRVGRQFIATDIALRKEETLRQRGLREAPTNLKLIKNCSMKELKKLPNLSQDIVFESYFLNNYIGLAARSGADATKLFTKFLKEVKRVLKPNGRLVIIQNVPLAQVMLSDAKKLNFKGHIVSLTEKQLTESMSEAIQKRSTLQKRQEIFDMDVLQDIRLYERSEENAKKFGLKDLADVRLPCALILRK